MIKPGVVDIISQDCLSAICIARYDLSVSKAIYTILDSRRIQYKDCDEIRGPRKFYLKIDWCAHIS